MSIKYFSSIFFLIFSFCAFAQKNELLLKLKDLPIKGGIIFKFEPQSTACCMTQQDGVMIVSKKDSVFSNIDGVIAFAGEIVDESAVIIKTDESIFISFSQIKSINVKKANKIKKGDFIGLLKPDEDNLLSLHLIVCNSRGVFYNEAETVSFLKLHSLLPCTSNDQPIVAR